MGHLLAVVCESEPGHTVNKKRGEVNPPSVLAGAVVARKCVVVVVIPLADRPEGHEEILGRVDKLVVGFIAPHVSSAVHQPRHVEGDGVSECGTDEVADHETFPPEVHRDDGWEDKTEEEDGWKVEPGMEATSI